MLVGLMCVKRLGPKVVDGLDESEMTVAIRVGVLSCWIASSSFELM